MGYSAGLWGLLSSLLWAAQLWTVEELTGQNIMWVIVGSLFAVDFPTGSHMIVRTCCRWLAFVAFFQNNCPGSLGARRSDVGSALCSAVCLASPY